MIDFTLAIVNWNTCELLRNCLKSIQENSGGFTLQILILDNASSDDSVSMIEAEFPEVILVKSEVNLGFAKGHEQLLPCSQGRFHILVNSDIEIKPGCLETIFRRMTQDRLIGVLGPQIVDDKGAIQPSCRRLPGLILLLWDAIGIGKILGGWFNPYHLGTFNHDKARGVGQVMGSFFVIRSSLFPQIGFLDTRFFMYFEEVDYCKRVYEKGYRVFFEPQAKVYHLGGGSSQAVKIPTIRRTMRSMHHYFRKHYGKWVYAPILLIAAIDTASHFAFSLIRFRKPWQTLKAYCLGFWDILTFQRADQLDLDNPQLDDKKTVQTIDLT